MTNFALAASTGSIITEGVKTAFTNAVSNVLTDVSSFIGLALPAGLAIMGGFLAIRLGVKFFQSVAH